MISPRIKSSVALFLVSIFIFSIIPAPVFAVLQTEMLQSGDSQFDYPEEVEVPDIEYETYEHELRTPIPDECEEPAEELYGQPVEINMYEKIYRTGPRSFRSVFSEVPNTYIDEYGSEQLIDNTLEEVNTLFQGSYFENSANDFNFRIPKTIDKDNPIRYEKDGISFTIAPLTGDYSRPAVEGNAVLYNDVYEGIDVQYKIRETYVKEDIILNHYVENNRFEYLLSLDKGTYAELKNNQIEIYKKGIEDSVFTLSAPCMTDSNAVVSGDITLSLEEQDGDYLVTVTADEQWLADPARVFPIYIDPNVTTVAFATASLVIASPSGRYADQAYGYVGNVNETVTGVPGGILGYSRMMIQVNTASYVFIPEEAVIDSAFLRMYQYGHHDASTQFICTGPTSWWDPSTISWTQAAGLNSTVTGQNAILTSGNGFKNFDIREAVVGWHQGILLNHGLMVSPVDENSTGGAFFTVYSDASKPGQGGFSADRAPHIVVDWSIPDPVPTDWPLNGTTVVLRPYVTSSISGQLNLRGVSADGVATPGSQVSYSLSDASKNYNGLVPASFSYRYPSSKTFENSMPAGTTKYRDKLSNWQTIVPFSNFTFNDLYQIRGRATINNGVTYGTQQSSDRFTVYQVKQYDTLQKIANHYGIPINQISFDNRIRDMLMVQNNTLFIRNPTQNANIPYNPAPLTDEEKRRIDGLLMGRGLHCEFGFEPINLNNGNFFMESMDIELDNGHDFSLSRTYNSKRSQLNSVFGRGWEFEYSESLSRLANGNLSYMRGDGSIIEFKRITDTTYEGPEGYYLSIRPIRVATGRFEYTDYNANDEPIERVETYPIYEWEITDGQKTVKRFDRFGSLISITDVLGEVTTLTYDNNYNLTGITTPTNLTYQIRTRADGKIDRITLPNGGRLRYTYDSQGRLTSFIDAEGNQTEYAYDSRHRMTSWDDPNGDRQIVNRYDSEDRVTRQIDANGGYSYLEYGDNQTITTDALGNRTVYLYDDQYRTLKIIYPDGEEETNTYFENTRVSSTDRAGNTTTYTYDSNGNVTSETRFDGAVRTYEYNASSQMTKSVDWDGYTQDFVYDASGNLIEMYVGGELEATYTYDSRHRVRSVTNALGQQTTFTYVGRAKLPVTSTNALGDTTEYFHDSLQQISAITDPLGITERYFYDLMGDRIKTQNGEGAIEEFVFSPAGDVIALIDAQGHAMNFDYDAMGNMTSGYDSQGTRLVMTYDAINRKLTQTDGDGSTLEYTYDLRDNVIEELQPDGKTIKRTFDVLGNMLTLRDSREATTTYTYDLRTNQVATITDALGATTRFEYNEVGLLLRKFDSLEATTTYEYDYKRQLTKTIEPDGLETQYFYDDAGNLTATFDNANRVLSYQYDDAGQMITFIDALGNRTEYVYDASGRLITTIDAHGNETHMTYDDAHQVLSITDPTGAVTAFEYDLIGNVTAQIDPRGAIARFEYDPMQNVTAMTNPYGARTAYEYSLGEQMTSETDPFGATTSYSYNALRMMDGIIDAHGNEYHFEYDAMGNETKTTLPNGAVTQRTFDALNRLVEEIGPEGLVTTFEYDSESRLIRTSNNIGAQVSYSYDAIGQITRVTDGLGRTESYTYDRARNIIEVDAFDGNITTYEYDLSGNLIKAVDAEGKVTTYEYDGLSRLITTIDDAYRTWQYVYDNVGRITQITDPLEQVESYEYDAGGNVTAHIDQKDQRQTFEYDIASNLTARTDRRGQTSTIGYDVIGRPIARTEPDGGVQELLYDALGNLIRHKDELDNITEFEYDAMGNTILVTNPTGAQTSFEYDLASNVTKEIDALGGETTYAYDAAGRLISRIAPNGGIYTYSYDVLDRITDLTAPGNMGKSYTYDVRGDLVRETDQSDRTVRYSYDIMHRVTSITNPEKKTTVFDYDEHGNLASVLTPMGAKTTYTYDPLDRIKQTTEATGLITNLEYDGLGNIETIKQNGGRVTSYAYDENSNVTAAINALGNQSSYVYDEVGRLVAQTNASGRIRAYSYDLKGQLIGAINERGGQELYTYDAAGNITQTMDATGREINYSYDALDRLSSVKEGDIETSYAYDSVGNMTSRKDGAGKTTEYTYDRASRLTSITDPAKRMQKYSYDDAGRLSRLTQADGSRITYDYDKLDQLVSREAKDESGALYAYDADGRRTSMIDAYGVTDYVYDDAGRITQVTTEDGEIVKYTYDVFSNITRLTYPDNTSVRYTYDRLNRLTKVIDRDKKETVYTYDVDDNMVGIKRPNGTSTELSYDDMGAVTELINYGKGKEQISRFTYLYDLSGRIISENTYQKGLRILRTIEYDVRGQIVKVEETENLTHREITYTYDGAGNRLTQTIKEGNKTTDKIEYTYSRSNQLMRVDSTKDGVTTFSYDERGNRITKASGDTTFDYDWDLQNRLEAVERNGTLLFAALYDGDSNRIFTAQRNRNITTTEHTSQEDYDYNYTRNFDVSFGYKSSIPTTSTETTVTARTSDKVRSMRDTLISYLSDFWYGFNQGFTSRMCVNSAQASRWLYVNWDLIAMRESSIERYVTDKGEPSSIEKKGKRTTKLVDAVGIKGASRSFAGSVFIPESNTSTTRKDYELTFYVNDINTAYTRTLVEYDANGQMTNTFEYGDTLLARETTHGRESYLYDGRGSVANITDSSGAMVASYTYDTFGTPKLSGMSTNPYSYNAERIDRTTGLQYLRARYLDTSVGGFISQDTYLGELLKPLTQNQYIYTVNDPMNHIDPSGHWGVFKSVGSAISGAASSAWSATKSVASSAWNATKSFASNTWNSVTSFFSPTVAGASTGSGGGASGSGGGFLSFHSGGGGGSSGGGYCQPPTLLQKAQFALAEQKRKFCTTADRIATQTKDVLKNADWKQVAAGAAQVGAMWLLSAAVGAVGTPIAGKIMFAATVAIQADGVDRIQKGLRGNTDPTLIPAVYQKGKEGDWVGVGIDAINTYGPAIAEEVEKGRAGAGGSW